MAYVKTNWVDGVTPLSAQNMNKIESGIKAPPEIIKTTSGKTYEMVENGHELVMTKQSSLQVTPSGMWQDATHIYSYNYSSNYADTIITKISKSTLTTVTTKTLTGIQLRELFGDASYLYAMVANTTLYKISKSSLGIITQSVEFSDPIVHFTQDTSYIYASATSTWLYKIKKSNLSKTAQVMLPNLATNVSTPLLVEGSFLYSLGGVDLHEITLSTFTVARTVRRSTFRNTSIYKFVSYGGSVFAYGKDTDNFVLVVFDLSTLEITGVPLIVPAGTYNDTVTGGCHFIGDYVIVDFGTRMQYYNVSDLSYQGSGLKLELESLDDGNVLYGKNSFSEYRLKPKTYLNEVTI